MNLNINCRYINWDRPCEFHKKSKVECSSCKYFEEKGTSILIIKLDARGDVLRTTSILRPLKLKYPKSHITWITMPHAKELLVNNPYINRICSDPIDIIPVLNKEQFDIVINPDASPRSARLAELALGKEKFGFGCDKDGNVIVYNREAQKWFDLGIDDNLKRANTETYQDIVLDMLKLNKGDDEIILVLSKEEESFRERFAKKYGIKKNDLVIGLNTGAGGRWKYKSWHAEYTIKLIELIDKKLKAKVILYGGHEEKERNRSILQKVKVPVIDAGTENTIREFISLIKLSKVLVTSDSLALHSALSQGVKVAVLFGPTSSAEIKLYGLGEPVVTSLECRTCYKLTCSKSPNCMETIKPEMVLKCIRKLL